MSANVSRDIRKGENMFARQAGAALCAVLCLAAGVAFARAQTTSFDVSGSDGTYGVVINVSEVIAGNYAVGQTYHAFVRTPDGTITTFDPQGSVLTVVNGIDSKGAIAGTFDDSNYVLHGYLRSPKGKMITRIDVPGSNSTSVSAISNGTIAGGYCCNGGGGFLRSPDGTFTTFGVPDALATVPTGINAGGVIVGGYDDDNGVGHGFVRAADGTIATFDPPGATITFATTINGKGTIAGYYADSLLVTHGFIRTPTGTFTEFDPSGSTDTTVMGIDEKGGVVGSYYDNSCGGEATACGFARAPDGKIETFSINRDYTVANGVAGVGGAGTAITGYWAELGGLHGFLRTK